MPNLLLMFWLFMLPVISLLGTFLLINVSRPYIRLCLRWLLPQKHGMTESKFH